MCARFRQKLDSLVGGQASFRKSPGVERDDLEWFDSALLGSLIILCGINKQFQQIAQAVSLVSA